MSELSKDWADLDDEQIIEKLEESINLDSEILMAKAINKDRKYILLNLEKKINKENLNNFEKLIKKRSNKKPIAYLTNKKYFLDLKIPPFVEI